MNKLLLTSTLAFALLTSVAFAKDYATVDGEAITDEDIAALLRATPNVNFNQLPQEAQNRVVEQAIERRLLIKQAKKDKIQNSDEYKTALKNMQDELALEIWMRKKMQTIKVTDAELKAFYEENKAKLVQPETIKARHILVSTEKEAKDIISQLDKAGKNLGTKFAELAKANSKDPSKDNGGDLGWFSKEQMVPEFANVAFGLKPGAFTKTPTKTNFGYHVIYVEDKKPSQTMPLEQVRPQLEQSLRLRKFQDEVAKEGKVLRDKAKVSLSK